MKNNFTRKQLKLLLNVYIIEICYPFPIQPNMDHGLMCQTYNSKTFREKNIGENLRLDTKSTVHKWKTDPLDFFEIKNFLSAKDC